MSSAKLEVIWSPVHHDKFIIWGPDITLYEVSRLNEIEKNNTTFKQISSTRGVTVVASQSASGVRCVDISAIPEHPDPLLALGHASGKVNLTSLKQTYDPLGLVGREFVPKCSRLCNSVSWSHTETNLLAIAMEKHRSDHCILLWDVNKGMSPENSVPGPILERSLTRSDSQKPLAEMGLSETAHSISWCNGSNRTLLASMNLKYIKLFDLRDLSNKAVNTTTTRYCYGVCADPSTPWQIASRGDNVVCVWDTRSFGRPILTITQQKPISKIQWCPTRRNLLMSLQRDSNTLKLHDIQQSNSDYRPANDNETDNSTSTTAVEAELEQSWGDGSAHLIERELFPAIVPVTTFSWHPQHSKRMLVLTNTGSMIDMTVCERVTCAWGAGGGLVWCGGGGALRLMRDDFYSALQDVSYVMRGRAQTDYGLKPDLWQNADLADDEVLSSLWHFLALSRSLVEDGCIRSTPWKHPGVRTVLKPTVEGGYRSEMVPSLLPDIPNRRVTIYKSGERLRALQLCGWGWGWENWAAGVERAEAEGTPCRAAALAAFHLRVRPALDVLVRAKNPQLQVVALAIAGLGEERLWREALAAALPALPDAYLRALLHFLAASAPFGPAQATEQADLSAVLNEVEMRLEDRVAFACIFLSDAKLHDYVKLTCDQLVAQGDLSGILLTGISPDGISLLQRWVENTGDVQTVALIAARCCGADLLRNASVRHWLDSYRLLLDSWKLWWARCALDTWVVGGGGAGQGGSGVSVACTYCGKSVAAPHQGRQRAPFARLPPPAVKCKQISVCPNCRKPLPRCGVCSLHLGTSGGTSPFSSWFSWCVACRHGGHADHLINWFKEHSECPVSSCTCRCGSLDPPETMHP